MGAEAIGEYVITSHAAFQMARRGITKQELEAVVTGPEQRLTVRPGRIVLQSRVARETKNVVLLRVFIDIDRQPAEVVTTYVTSNVSKYWSGTDEN